MTTRPADEILSYGAGPDRVVEVWRPTAGPRAVMAMLVHGGFWRPEHDRAHLRSAAAALALAPAADLRLSDELGLGGGAVRAFLGSAPAQRPDIDPTTLPTPRTAVTVLQGEEDAVVPSAVAQSYLRRHPRARLVSLPATGHFALIDPLTPAWAVVTAELDRLSA